VRPLGNDLLRSLFISEVTEADRAGLFEVRTLSQLSTLVVVASDLVAPAYTPLHVSERRTSDFALSHGAVSYRRAAVDNAQPFNIQISDCCFDRDPLPPKGRSIIESDRCLSTIL
jgi:hypothetical protein